MRCDWCTTEDNEEGYKWTVGREPYAIHAKCVEEWHDYIVHEWASSATHHGSAAGPVSMAYVTEHIEWAVLLAAVERSRLRTLSDID